MANTISVVANSRTPLSVIIDVNNDGTAGAPAGLSQAQLLAALLDGPLKTYLSRLAAWGDNSNAIGPIRVTEIVGGTTTPVAPTTGAALLSWTTAPNALAAALPPNGIAPTRVLWEIRLCATREY